MSCPDKPRLKPTKQLTIIVRVACLQSHPDPIDSVVMFDSAMRLVNLKA
jgi:hypothetical protein